MNKKIIFGVSILLIGIVAVIVFLVVSKNNEDINVLDIKETESATTIHKSRAVWASNATTVKELMLESDLVVRARVVEAPVTRVIRVEAPTLDEKGNIVDSTVIKVLFSDTVFEVLKTYVGKPSLKITVMQTGGFDPTVSRGVEEITDDPLYKVGEEYILFLVDISGDHVHAADRELYRIVNPSGRYGINGESVLSYGENLQSVQLPTEAAELETQIEQAISLIPTSIELLIETRTPSPTQTPLPTETTTPTP